MALSEKTTHEAEALATLLQQFKGKAKLAAWIGSYVAEIQEVEGAFFDVLASRAVDVAEGDQLDLLGGVVGQDREGRSDADYRVWIKARIRVNLASGTPDEVIATVGLILGESGRVTLVEHHPASFLVTVADALGVTAADVAELISQLRGAAIGCQLVYATVSDADAFTFSSGDAEEASTAQGWADDAQTTGGQMADALEA